jgi:hypothetical protein
MAFIGNTNTTQSFTPAIDYFSGNGSTTAFTLSRPVASVAQVEAVIDNVVQNPSSAYTVSSNTITFTSAPLSGTNNIYVRYTSPITQVIAPGQGTVTSSAFASGASEFASGTVLLFQQTSAPTGWTKSTTHNDKALRVVSGSASSGGSVAFTTAFTSQAVSGSVGTSGATTLSTSQIPSHTHNLTAPVVWSTYSGGNPPTLFSGTTSAANSGTPGYWNQPDNTGGGGSHTHPGGSFTGTAINLAVQYVDVIIATKD